MTANLLQTREPEGGEADLSASQLFELLSVEMRRFERRLLLAEDVAHAADLSSYPTEFFFDAFVAAIDVVDAVEDGFSVGDESGEDK